jgi:hypothetical protein
MSGYTRFRSTLPCSNWSALSVFRLLQATMSLCLKRRYLTYNMFRCSEAQRQRSRAAITVFIDEKVPRWVTSQTIDFRCVKFRAIFRRRQFLILPFSSSCVPYMFSCRPRWRQLPVSHSSLSHNSLRKVPARASSSRLICQQEKTPPQLWNSSQGW